LRKTAPLGDHQRLIARPGAVQGNRFGRLNRQGRDEHVLWNDVAPQELAQAGRVSTLVGARENQPRCPTLHE
jgi:hypothetical protein